MSFSPTRLIRGDSPTSIKQLRHDDRVARQAISREERYDDGSERVSRRYHEQGGECRILDNPAQHVGRYGRKRGEEL